MFNKTSKPQNRIDSLIGATTRIEGNVIFSGGLRVDGMVRGNVAALPEQPPPVTNTRSFNSGLPSSSISCLTLFAALSVKISGAGISVTAFIS